MLQLGKRVMIFDGGIGTEIAKYGLGDFIPEELNITHSDVIKKIHLSYGVSDFITTNTFGLNKIKYHGAYSIKELALKAIENARVRSGYVMFNMGPTGKMLYPMGTLTFDEVYEAYKELVLITRDLVDGYIVETFSDLYELKAVILAVKENCDLPVFASMTFDSSHRTLTGTTPEIMVNTLEGLGVSALGVNCSLGPKDLYAVVKRITDVSHTPVLVEPNRGLPKIKDGKTIYDLDIEEYDYYIKKFLDLGVSVVGGCCGTNPEFINRISKYKGLEVVKRNNPYYTIINSSVNLVNIDNVVVCGERLNPTGKKKLKEAIVNENYDYLVNEAIKQEDNGAEILDLNVGVPKIDEVKIMRNAVTAIQEYSNLPLQIDSSNYLAIEAGCRYYNGIPLINSVNGEDEVMDKIFPIAKKYGAVVLGLAMDKNGVPKTKEQRFNIAKRIINKALEYGIPKQHIMIDTLVLTASAEQELIKETLGALSLVRGLGVKTALGVSNCSFGLPNRSLINRCFLAMAMYQGLNMPIMNPLDEEMMNEIYSYRVLMNIDKGASSYINRFQNVDKVEIKPKNELSLYDAIMKGLKNEANSLTIKELENHDPLDIVNNVIIKALNDVGKLYDSKKVFLPQLIASAEASKEAFSAITAKFPKSDSKKATVVFATVKGDVHDIGKNICKVVLESYGYLVIDLGKDTPIEVIVDAYYKYKPDFICLSALMTTTVVNMELTIKALRDVNCSSKILVGGAVVTSELAREIGADYYSKDALELVNMLEELI